MKICAAHFPLGSDAVTEHKEAAGMGWPFLVSAVQALGNGRVAGRRPGPGSGSSEEDDRILAEIHADRKQDLPQEVLEMVTDNTPDFQNIPGLRLENWLGS